MKLVTTAVFIALASLYSTSFAQIIPNGQLDNIDELILKTTTSVKTKDGVHLATDIYLPVFRDSITTNITLGATTYTIELIQKNTQFIVFDTSNFSANSYRLPIVYTRTPYGKNSDDVGSKIFPFMGYGYAIQDMRGRYDSEGVYFPMYSDSWEKKPYHPSLTIPMDLYPSSSLSNALSHSDGSETVFYLADSLYRTFDVDLDGTAEVFKYSNGSIGMFGASALGNSQYQALSNIPHSATNNPIKCLMPIVATNEHYNTTVANNGVYRNSLMTGWMTGQMDDLDDSSVATDNSLTNTTHTAADYGYPNKASLTKDLINWFVSNSNGGFPSGIYPNSPLRTDLDASFAKVNALGQTDASGTYSRYTNLNKPIYHLTGWWDIFINGQIETFNKVRNATPGSNQKLIIGPWTHQTVGSTAVGDEIYQENVYDVLGFDYNVDPNSLLNDSMMLYDIYKSELLAWFRSNLGGEPFFIIPESNKWQALGTNLVRIPSKNYIIPYYQFLNYLGGQGTLNNLPYELNNGTITLPLTYTLPVVSPPLINLPQPLSAYNSNYFNTVKDIRTYITGPSNDVLNQNVGNYWLAMDSLPFVNGVNKTKFYLHQNKSANSLAPSGNEGALSYTADPSTPVITIGGNNMIPEVPGGGQKSQGSMNVANPAYAPYTLNRADVLAFETSPLSDTMTVIGFPRASFYAKGHTTNYTTAKTNFDLMVRVIDVYPDGREMFITEGTVNAKAREYAKSIFNGAPNENLVLTNIDNDSYYHFEFEMLPLGHTFGKGHTIKFLVSSSNFPRYQSNPHIPTNTNEFFGWTPGDTTSYNYNGTWMQPQPSLITFDFNASTPSYIELPNVTELPNSVKENKMTDNFEVYPNPTNNLITLKRSKKGNETITVYSLYGSIMYEDSFNTNELAKVIDLSALSKGIYLITLKGENGSIRTQKVIKK